MASAPRIGFACVWDQPRPEATWSYTPWNLRAAMQSRADVVDCGVHLSPRTQLALKALHARRRGGRTVTTWRQSRLTDAYLHRVVNTAVTRAGCDAVLEIADLAALDRPFFLYQDLSFDALLAAGPAAEGLLPSGLAPRDLRRRQVRQRGIYERATGVFAMSHWFAGTLVELSGLPKEKVHVLHPGRSAVSAGLDGRPLPERAGPRRRLLLVGTDFLRKGGEQVLAALAILRRDVDPAINLTVVGPPRWPLPTEVPDGVTYLGSLPREEVAALYDTHDLFVMPSKLDGFGIVFAEALARGLPCIARDGWAMPELIEPGVTGALVRTNEPAELAGLVASSLADDALYAACRDKAPELAAWFTWERAGQQAVEVITNSL